MRNHLSSKRRKEEDKPSSPNQHESSSSSPSPPAKVSASPRPVLRRQNRTAEPQRPTPPILRPDEDIHRVRSQSSAVHGATAKSSPNISEDTAAHKASAKELMNVEGGERTSSPSQADMNRVREIAAKKHISDRPESRKSACSRRASPGIFSELSSPRNPSEAVISPSLNEAFSSPITPSPYPSSDLSARSSESISTIKGGSAPTPSMVPLRTPSYPFPYVSGQTTDYQPPETFSSSAKATVRLDRAASASFGATDTTVMGISPVPFSPQKLSIRPTEENAFPAPSVYDLVLRLSSEAGVDAWWDTTTEVLTGCFKAERVSLAMPADPSDLENVPWGQKASYNAAGIKTNELKTPSMDTPGPALFKNTPISSPGPGVSKADAARQRPKLVLRHSYAGHEGHGRASHAEAKAAGKTRPGPPKRLATQAHGTPFSRDLFDIPSTGLEEEENNPLRSIEKKLHPSAEHEVLVQDTARPRKARYPLLRALDRELCPLIDSTGINRVLQKGRLVALTRDYSANDHSPAKNLQEEQNAHSKSTSTNAKCFDTNPVSTGKTAAQFDEYEQFPTSPWAQSPAPSPAVQNDPDENPFFATSNIDEESFNPTAADDYSKYGAVPAIGVDKASTIIHIPLIHPLLSQARRPSLSARKHPQHRNVFHDERERGDSSSPESASQDKGVQTPIAILSILSPIVPYPQTLLGSLKLLAPHLATTFHNAEQFTNAVDQAILIRSQRLTSGSYLSMSLDARDNTSLENLVQVDVDDVRSSTAGSITSPSDYSGCSKNSPGPSANCTPNWEASNMSHLHRPGLVGTPNGPLASDGIDSYFDTIRGGHNRRLSGNWSLNLQSQPGGELRSPAIENPSSGPSHSWRLDEQGNATRPQFKSRLRSHFKAGDSMENDVDTEPSIGPSNRQKLGPVPLIDTNYKRPRTLLHSYGADFSSSFQSLPAATTPASRTQFPGSAEKKENTRADTFDMPPPSERLLRTIIDSLPVQIFTAAPTTGTLTWVNSKFLVYQGKDLKEILEEPWETVHPKDRVKYKEKWVNCLRTGHQMQHKFRLQRFDSHYRWFYIRAAPLKDKRQNIVHWIGTNMDIHEQHIAEVNAARQQETAASEARYRALANSSPQIVFAVTRSRGVIFCNSQWPSYSGQSEAEACGLGFMNFVHPEDLKKCKLPDFDTEGNIATNVPTNIPPPPMDDKPTPSDDIMRSSDTVTKVGRPSSAKLEMPHDKLAELADSGFLKASKDADGRLSYSTEVRIKSKEGVYRWHLVRVLLADPGVEGEEGEETWYGTCTDINDHKVLEQTLKNTMDAKSKFLSNMSHEIRTPLNGITGMVNFLMDSSLNSEQMEHVNIIRASTEGLRDLINDILDLSKVEAGMVTLNYDWFHVRSVIEDVCDLIYPLAIDKAIELNYILQEDVPPMVKGDKFRIRQVLLNVIGNAIKFTQQGEVFVRCKVLSGKHVPDRHETILQFDVVDTGSGFNEKEAEFLFKRFSQIDGSSTRQHGGTGLGLVISMQLVELHGGKMKASSKPGKGSTFTFSVKFATPSETDHPPANSRPPPKTLQKLSKASNFDNDKQIITHAAPSLSQKSFFPLISKVLTDSPLAENPTPGTSRSSPALSTSSSMHSSRTTGTSIPSTRSSVSSAIAENSSTKFDIALTLPEEYKNSDRKGDTSHSLTSNSSQTTPKSMSQSLPIRTLSGSLRAPMCSVLIVCPLKYSRNAAAEHVKMTIPNNVPSQITARKDLEECRELFEGEEKVIFTHIVLVLHDASDIINFVKYVFRSVTEGLTKLVVITDLAQKREIIAQSPTYDYKALSGSGRLQFVFRPLKPSKLALIFDPEKEREVSTDQNQNSGQQVAISQKKVFESTRNRLGNRGFRVLLVEDNRVNQLVSGLDHPLMVTSWTVTNIYAGSPQVSKQNFCRRGNCT